MTTIKLFTFGIAVLLTTLVGGNVAADECLRVESVPPKATVTLKGVAYRSFVAPGQYCSMEPGRTYRVTTSHDRFESRALKLRFPEGGGEIRMAGDRIGRIGRSILLPGWGQGSMGYAANAFEAVLGVGGSGLKFWQAHNRYLTAKDNMEFHRELAGAATTQQAVDQELAEMSRYERNSDLYRDNSYIVAGIVGWQVLGNVVETYLMAAPPGADVLDDGTVQLSIPERSGARAAMRSLFFPGLGQKYNGDHGKAMLFQFGTMVCGLFAADYLLEYKLEEGDYLAAMDRFKTATDPIEKDKAWKESRAYATSRDDRRQDMYVYAGGAGVLWFLSVIDAAANGGTREDPGLFGMETSYRSGTTRGAFVVRF